MASADHLQTPRRHGLFLHHGIDLGDGTVAHYLEGRTILRSSGEEFSRGEPISCVSYPEGACSPQGVVLRRAMGRLGEQNYNLLFNNCEHFAHWCKTGRHRSAQVESWLQIGSLGALALGQFVPATLLSGAGQLLRHGIGPDGGQLERGRELARRSLDQLEKLRRSLQEQLEELLVQVDRHWSGGSAGGEPDPFPRLRQAAQTLADQLGVLEDWRQRLGGQPASPEGEDPLGPNQG